MVTAEINGVPAMVMCKTCKSSRKTISSNKFGNRSKPTPTLYKTHTNRAPIPYEMTRRYSKGDVVDHRIYGEGEVKELFTDFMVVRFDVGTKRLICGRK